MTDNSTNCPTPEQLRALIDGALPGDELLAIQSHVDQCSACQRQLESLVAGSESWDAAAARLREQDPPAQDPAFNDAMRRMKTAQFMEEGFDPKADHTNPLDILTPSDHPGSLGKLGTYEITQLIGQGGMGVVLKAFDPALHRVVAVKILASHLAHNPRARKRFVREAQAIAAVTHEHVISIHGIEESERQPRIVMQFISGQSLQQKINNEGALPLKEILRIGMQTASGLSAAHAQGLVHRDVKPANILLENGVERVKLTDFGLARAVDDASLTQSGAIAGTPQYMAPEQANGDAVDHRADLFSLGSVMYAMCVGHSPFRASTTMGVLKRVCHDPPRPIQELNAEIPEWLSNIIMKLLAKDPADRFQSAHEVAELLERWLAYVQQPTAVEKPPLPELPKPQPARTVSPGQNNPRSETPQVTSRPAGMNWPLTPLLIVLFGVVAYFGIVVVSTQWGLIETLVFVTLLVLSLTALIAALETQQNPSQQSPDGSDIPATGNLELFATRYKQVLNWELAFLQQAGTWLWNGLRQLGSVLYKLNPFQDHERNRLMLVIAWAISCSIDLGTLIFCTVFSSMIRPHPNYAFQTYEILMIISIISALSALLAGMAACGLHWKRFLPLVRAVAFIGILPILPGSLFRIPLSITTLFWLHKPQTPTLPNSPTEQSP